METASQAQVPSSPCPDRCRAC